MSNKKLRWANNEDVISFTIEDDNYTDAFIGERGLLWDCDTQYSEWRIKARNLRNSYSNSKYREDEIHKLMEGSDDVSKYSLYIDELINVLQDQIEILEEHKELCEKNNRISCL